MWAAAGLVSVASARPRTSAVEESTESIGQPERTIVAMGGNDFGPPDNSLVDDHVIALARAQRGRERPRVCFVGDRQRRFARLPRQLLRGVRATVGGHPPGAVRPDDRRSGALRPGPGRHPRRRRQHRQHAGHLAGPRPRPGPGSRLGGGRRPRRLVRRCQLLVRGIHDRLVRRARAAGRRPRVPAGQLLAALRRRADAPAHVPTADRGRDAPRRARGRRRRRARVPRHGAGRGGRVATGRPGIPRRPRLRG